MGDQDGDGGVGAAGEGEGGAAFTYLDPIQVLKRAPSSLAWKFFQFRKYENKVDETRVFCRLCDGKRREDGLPYNSSTTATANASAVLRCTALHCTTATATATATALSAAHCTQCQGRIKDMSAPRTMVGH